MTEPSASSPALRRLADLRRGERTMLWVRALAVVFAAVQVLVYNALPYPPGYREAALALVGAMAVVDLVVLGVVLTGRPRTLPTARALALATVSLDTLVASGLVAAYSFDPASAHWAILFVIPLLGAARFQLRGALTTWVAVTALYTARQAFAADRFDGIGFSPTSIGFRMGLVLLVALVAGLLARDLARQREATAEALAEVARVDLLRRRLVDSLAHDIRSPLVTIAGALGALGPGRPPELQAQLLEMARRQTGRLTRLATGMLDLARLDEGRLVLDLRPTSLATVLDEVVPALQPEDEDGLTVEVPEGLAVQADPDRLDQIVYNLLANALRHGRPPVVLTAVQEGAQVRVTVVDHGSGVPPERQAGLFDAFVTTASDGVGLGLWLVRALVEAHGGRIAYRDADGGGACFEVHLPVASETAVPGAEVRPTRLP